MTVSIEITRNLGNTQGRNEFGHDQHQSERQRDLAPAVDWFEVYGRPGHPSRWKQLETFDQQHRNCAILHDGNTASGNDPLGHW